MDNKQKTTITRFEDIEAWQEARVLANKIYLVTSGLRFHTDYVLRDQIRRAAVSVLSNIAEGFERGGNSEFVHFLSIAKGSCGEVRAQLYLAHDFGYIDGEEHKNIRKQSESVSRLIHGFMRYLQNSKIRGLKYRSEPQDSPPET